MYIVQAFHAYTNWSVQLNFFKKSRLFANRHSVFNRMPKQSANTAFSGASCDSLSFGTTFIRFALLHRVKCAFY